MTTKIYKITGRLKNQNSITSYVFEKTRAKAIKLFELNHQYNFDSFKVDYVTNINKCIFFKLGY